MSDILRGAQKVSNRSRRTFSAMNVLMIGQVLVEGIGASTLMGARGAA